MVEPRPTSNEDVLWFRYLGEPTQTHRNDLVTHYLGDIERIAASVARKRPGVEPEDLIGSGCIGMIAAIERFDPDIGPFNHYYPGKVRNAMLSGLRIGTPLQSSTARANPTAAGHLLFPLVLDTLGRDSYDPHNVTSGDAAISSFDELPNHRGVDPADAFEMAQLRALLVRSIAALAPRHRAILGLRYRTDLSVEDTARLLCCSRSWVAQLTNAAVEALRDEMLARST